MARPGPVGKNSRADEWIEVPDVPYEGRSPELPKLPHRRKWYPQVEGWWEQVRRMPHCLLWSPSDWVYALELAYLKQDWWNDYQSDVVYSTKSTEIRRREDVLGTTAEARRKLRIRYVPVELADEKQTPEQQAAAAVEDEVAKARRRRIAEAS